MSDYPASEFESQLAKKDSHEWGVEAFQLAVDHIYSFTKTNKQITEEYQNQIRPLLFKQLALGGYRLANAIADVYA